MASRELTAEYLASRDCVLIVTDHSAYDWDCIAQHAPLIVDTRNATRDVVAPEGHDRPRLSAPIAHRWRDRHEQNRNWPW